MFKTESRAKVFLRAAEWCATHEWYSTPVAEAARAAADPNEAHLALLATHVPGFRTVWFSFESDLRIAVEPFWEWEEGNPVPLIENLDKIACYFAFYDRPLLVKVAQLTLRHFLHYTDVSAAGRPDLLVLICHNCMWLNERFIELHHSMQVRIHIGEREREREGV